MKARLLLSLDPELKKMAMAKSKVKLGIPFSSLLQLFTRAFVYEKNIGFYLGDDDFNGNMRRMIFAKRMTRLMTERRKAIRAQRAL